jgi:hypothetical protein
VDLRCALGSVGNVRFIIDGLDPSVHVANHTNVELEAQGEKTKIANAITS